MREELGLCGGLSVSDVDVRLVFVRSRSSRGEDCCSFGDYDGRLNVLRAWQTAWCVLSEQKICWSWVWG